MNQKQSSSYVKRINYNIALSSKKKLKEYIIPYKKVIKYEKASYDAHSGDSISCISLIVQQSLALRFDQIKINERKMNQQPIFLMKKKLREFPMNKVPKASFTVTCNSQESLSPFLPFKRKRFIQSHFGGLRISTYNLLRRNCLESFSYFEGKGIELPYI